VTEWQAHLARENFGRDLPSDQPARVTLVAAVLSEIEFALQVQTMREEYSPRGRNQEPGCGSKVYRCLDIDPIGISGTVGWSRKAFLDVVADEEVAVANFNLSEGSEGEAADDIKFSTEKVVVAGVDAVAGARRCGGASASGSSSGVETVVRIRKPETVPFDGQARPRVRLELKNSTKVVHILQRKKIHIAIELVVRRKEIFESFMLAVLGVAVAGAMGVFETEARFGPCIEKCVAALKDDHVGVMIESFRGRAGSRITEVAKLIRAFERVIEIAQFTGF
jgi:hypothetical protein